MGAPQCGCIYGFEGEATALGLDRCDEKGKAASSAYGSEAIRTVLVAPSKSSGINAARQDGSYCRTIAPLFSMRSASSSAGCEAAGGNGCA